MMGLCLLWEPKGSPIHGPTGLVCNLREKLTKQIRRGLLWIEESLERAHPIPHRELLCQQRGNPQKDCLTNRSFFS